MTERLPCKNPECDGTILPSTAEATGGFCRPCANQAKQRERDKFIAEHRIDVDRFKGIDDPVEIIRRLHARPPNDPLKNYLPYSMSIQEVYRSLSSSDATRLLKSVSKDDDLLGDVASHLACFAPVDLTTCQMMLAKRQIVSPAYVFRDAASPVVDRLYSLLKRAVGDGDDIAIQSTLAALAWTRSDRVIRSMTEWAEKPPAWRSVVSIPPHDFAKDAGYEVASGRLRELVYTGAHRLAPAPAGTLGVTTLFRPDPSGETCPGCHGPVSFLLDLAPEMLPAPLRRRGRLFVPTCLRCACSQHLFVRVEGDTWTWFQWAPDRILDWSISASTAQLLPRPDWEVVDYGICEDISQLGGLPSWVQDPEYPDCPMCSQTMPFLAQVAMGDFSGPNEGVYYIHLCDKCSVLAVGYNQT